MNERDPAEIFDDLIDVIQNMVFALDHVNSSSGSPLIGDAMWMQIKGDISNLRNEFKLLFDPPKNIEKKYHKTRIIKETPNLLDALSKVGEKDENDESFDSR